MNSRMNTIFYTWLQTPFGDMGLAKTNLGLCKVFFPEAAPFEIALQNEYKDAEIIFDNQNCKQEKDQIKEYFSGKRNTFDLALDIQKPDFYTKALQEVRKVPYGKTASYKEIAIRSGNPHAVRAVGSANANNPLPIVIPCHRIINSNGDLGGYGGRLDRKVYLLEMEGAL